MNPNSIVQPRTCIIRHGETDMNCHSNDSADQVRGWLDVPLNATGIKTAHRTAQVLKHSKEGLDVLVHSDLDRSRETAEIIAKALGIPCVASFALRPWDAGELAGQSAVKAVPIMQDYLVNKPDKNLPGGESFNQFKERTFGGVYKALRDHAGAYVGLVTHHRVERLLKAWIAAGEPAGHDIDAELMLKKGDAPGHAEFVTFSLEMLK